MRQADTTQETPGGNRGIAIALTRRLRCSEEAVCQRGVSSTTCPLVSTRGLPEAGSPAATTPPLRSLLRGSPDHRNYEYRAL